MMLDIQWFPWGLFIVFAGAVIIGYVVMWFLSMEDKESVK